MKILVIKPSSLGDVIHALPTVRVLRRAFPQAHIAWLINDNLAPLLEGSPVIDRVIPFARGRFSQPRHFGDFLNFVRQLRHERFDWTIDLQGLLRSGLLSLASGARRRTGLSDGRESSTLFYNEPIEVPAQPMHAVDRCLLLAHQFGLPVDRVDFPLGGPAVAQRERLIVVNPCARWFNKRWPTERFSALLDALAARWPDHRLAVIGTAAERAHVEAVVAASRAKIEMLAGCTSLQELISLMRRAQLVISNDTGPMHLAVAVKTPVVAIFGPTDPRLTGPYPPDGDSNIVLRSGVACSPCLKPFCAHTPQLECLTRIEVNQVLAAAERLLGT